jgi:hypothetical protein
MDAVCVLKVATKASNWTALKSNHFVSCNNYNTSLKIVYGIDRLLLYRIK